MPEESPTCAVLGPTDHAPAGLKRYVRVHENDHVAIAVEALSAGEKLTIGDLHITL